MEQNSPQFPNSVTILQKSLIWKFPKELGSGLAGFSLYGNSWACDQTAFQIPELGWGLDIGFIPHNQRRTHLFLTHAHGDHSTSLPFAICRRVPPDIFLPGEVVDSCRDYLEGHLNFRLADQDIGEMLPTYHLKGVRGNEKIRLTGKSHSDKLVQIYSMYHSVPCVGYGFLLEKKRLKSEYIGLQGKQLGELRKQGTNIEEFYECPIFAFLGDTTTQLFDEHAELEKKGKDSLFKYPLIMVECTFLGTDEKDAERATSKKHVLWDDLKPHVQAHPKIIFVLIHFSHRYSPVFIREFFEKENLANTVPWVESKDVTIVQSADNDENDD